MKTIKKLFFINAFILSASYVSAQTDFGSNATAIRLQEALLQFEAQYQVKVYAQPEWLQTQVSYSSCDNKIATQCLTSILTGTQLSFIPLEDFGFVVAPTTMVSKVMEEVPKVFSGPKVEETALLKEKTDSIIVIGNQDAFVPNSRTELKGRIFDQANNEVITGVAIAVLGTNLGTFSDDNGNFTLELPVGINNLTIQMVGYQTQKLGINVLSKGKMDIPMAVEGITLTNIIVREYARDENIESAIIGVQALSPTQIKALPALLGEADVVRSLLTLPGISSSGDGATGFNVRGAPVDQNLVMQDQNLLFNTGHALGFFSVFHPDAIKNITLYKGHIPARYGGRLASVLDVEMRNGNLQEWHGAGGVGPLASRFMIEGPLVENKLSVISSVRGSYLTPILSRMRDYYVSSSETSFYDAQIKLTYKPNAKNFINLSTYQSQDFFKYSTLFGFDWKNQWLGASWKSVLSETLSHTLTLNTSNYTATNFIPNGSQAQNQTNGLESKKIKSQWLLLAGSSHLLNFGGEFLDYSLRNERITPRGEQSTLVPLTLNKPQGRELAFFIEDDWNPFSGLSLNVGLRYSSFADYGPYTSYTPTGGFNPDFTPQIDTSVLRSGRFGKIWQNLEPRIGVNVKLGDDIALKLSYNRNYQYLHLLSNTAAATPTDVWVISNERIAPQSANNYSIGLFKNFELDAWESGLEFFYRDLQNVIDYPNLSQLFNNPLLESSLLRGQGRSYGVEMFVKKQFGKVKGSASYTVSKTQQRIKGDTPSTSINGGSWYNGYFDQPQQIRLNLNYRWNRTNMIGFAFTYNSGRPITIPVRSYLVNNILVPEFSDRNAYRIPSYHRLDINYTIDPKNIRPGKYKWNLTISIFNVYGRANPFSVYFDRRGNNFRPTLTQLSLIDGALPGITYNFNF